MSMNEKIRNTRTRREQIEREVEAEVKKMTPEEVDQVGERYGIRMKTWEDLLLEEQIWKLDNAMYEYEVQIRNALDIPRRDAKDEEAYALLMSLLAESD